MRPVSLALAGLLLLAAPTLAATPWTVPYAAAARDPSCAELDVEAAWGAFGDLAACVVTTVPDDWDGSLHLRVVDALAPAVGGAVCVGPSGCAERETWFCRGTTLVAEPGDRVEVHLGGPWQSLCLGVAGLVVQPAGGEVRFGPPPPPPGS